MSTLRINNIEAQSIPASPTIDEKVKVTNSSGDILVNIDGKTSGITTIGINTTDGNIKFDANSNVLITGILTATTLSGNFTPTSLEVGSNIKLGNAGVITATSFVGSGANLTSLPAQVTISNNADNRVITGGSGTNLNGEANLKFDGTNLDIDSDSGHLRIGDDQDLDLYHNGSNGYLKNSTGQQLYRSGTHTFENAAGSTEYLRINSSGQIGIGANNNDSYDTNARNVLIASSGNTGITIRSGGSSNYAMIHFADGTTGAAQQRAGRILYEHGTDSLQFSTANTYHAKITSTGQFLLGTGTAYTGANMEIRSTDSGGDTQLRITNNATAANTKAGIVFTTSTGDYASGSIRYERNAGLAQGSGGSMGTYDALVLTAWAYGSANPWSGNTQNGMYLWGQSGTGAGGYNQAIGIGTDLPPQNTNGASGNSNGPALFCTAEGGNAITLLGRTPTPAGNDDIVGINFAARNYFGTTGRSGITYQIICQNGHGSYGDRGQLRFNPGYNGNSTSDGKGMVMEFNGHFRPTHDNAQNLGSGSLRWNTIYAASINNSDINLKQNIAGLSDAEMKAASRISKIFKTYRWKESVEEKGVDKARIHTGVIAQTVKTELEAEGLDPSKYAFYCQDTGWYKDGVLLGDGITHGPGVYDKLNDETPSTVGFTSTTTYAIRYVELLSFLAAYNEQRFTSIESRLTALEGS